MAAPRSPLPVYSPDEVSSALEPDVIELFIVLAETFHLPRSLGAIYGLLFCREDPVPFDELVASLGLSKGSVSSGLKALQQLQAVRPVIVGDDRRSFFEAEIELRRMLSGFLESKLRPQLRRVDEKLEQLDQRLGSEPPQALRGLAERLAKFRTWSRRARDLLPTMEDVFGVSDNRDLA